MWLFLTITFIYELRSILILNFVLWAKMQRETHSGVLLEYKNFVFIGEIFCNLPFWLIIPFTALQPVVPGRSAQPRILDQFLMSAYLTAMAPTWFFHSVCSHTSVCTVLGGDDETHWHFYSRWHRTIILISLLYLRKVPLFSPVSPPWAAQEMPLTSTWPFLPLSWVSQGSN